MHKAYNLIFWGAVITFFNINIGRLNLLPNCVGYIIIAVGSLNIIKNTDKPSDAKKANALALALAFYSFFMLFTDDAFSIVANTILTTVFMTADMLMCYYILSSGACDSNKETISKQQRNFLLMAAIAAASYCMTVVILAISWVPLIFGFASKIYFIYLCHKIRRGELCSPTD